MLLDSLALADRMQGDARISERQQQLSSATNGLASAEPHDARAAGGDARVRHAECEREAQALRQQVCFETVLFQQVSSRSHVVAQTIIY